MKRILISIALLCLGSLISRADEGMWMINMINSALEKKMQERGLLLSADEIYNADADGTTISDAVVSLEFGCSGSIISDQGLMITNHHCAYADVYNLSTPEHNYLEDGYWAMTADKEINIPGKSILFLKKVIDVTDEVKAFRAELRAAGKPAGMRKVSFQMEKKYAKESGLDAYLSSMWDGSRYYMALYKTYKDIRLVAAPPVSIAAYGGDVDNWEWPQHKCDFALYRIYTAPDGSPAEYSEENIPLVPERKLEISLDGYKPGDFAMVIGFPGMTDRYSSSAKVNFKERVSLPISNELRGAQMDIISRWMNTDPDIRLLYSDYFFGLSNVQENNEGMAKCFRRFGVVDEKKAVEKELQEWIDASEERKAKWGNLIGMLNEKYAAQEEAQKDVTYYRETLVRGTQFAKTVNRISTMGNSVLKSCGIKPARTIDQYVSDEEKECRRCHRFCGQDFEIISNAMKKDYEAIDLRVEKDLFRYAVEQYYDNVDPSCFGPYQTGLLEYFTKEDGKCDFDALVDSLWNNSYLTDLDRLGKMIGEEHTIDEYTADPMYKFFKDVSIIDFNHKISAAQGSPKIMSLDNAYTHALYQMKMEKGIEQYPDANSTMRITYGTVGGLEPYDAVICSWQTTTDGLLEKDDPSSYDFCLGERQRELLQGLEEPLPVDFLTDNDITGGNSGSPVMNAKGELIGLAFDGNKESLASDASYTPGYNKCVCVDIRFVLWTLDEYAGMDRILDEIGYDR